MAHIIECDHAGCGRTGFDCDGSWYRADRHRRRGHDHLVLLAVLPDHRHRALRRRAALAPADHRRGRAAEPDGGDQARGRDRLGPRRHDLVIAVRVEPDDELGPVAHAELLVDPGQVGRDGLGAQEQRPADLGRRSPRAASSAIWRSVSVSSPVGRRPRTEPGQLDPGPGRESFRAERLEGRQRGGRVPAGRGCLLLEPAVDLPLGQHTRGPGRAALDLVVELQRTVGGGERRASTSPCSARSSASARAAAASIAVRPSRVAGSTTAANACSASASRPAPTSASMWSPASWRSAGSAALFDSNSSM